MDCEKEPMLPHGISIDYDNENENGGPTPPMAVLSFRRIMGSSLAPGWLLFTHLVIFIAWVCIAVSQSMTMHHHCGTFAPSPAQSALSFEAQVQHLGGPPRGPYGGEPDDTKDAAWKTLLRNSNIRLSDHELDEIGVSKEGAVSLPDGGYLASLAVFHQLHCVRNLRHFLYQERYFPPLSDSQKADRRVHLDHCLDVLRAGVMCNADVAPLTMRWRVHVPKPLANFSAAHSCANWKALDDWAGRRQIPDLFKPGYLRHPEFGDVFGTARDALDNLLGVVHEQHDAD